MQITLATLLKPWLIASKDVTRPLLAHLEVSRAPTGGNHGLLVATDTCRLVALPCTLTDAPESFTRLLLPAGWVENVAKTRPAGQYSVTIDIDLERRVARALTKTAIVETALGEGKFPDWRRMLECEFNRASCPAAQDDWHAFSAKQLAEVATALGVENGHTVSWFQRQPAAPLVILPPQGQFFSGIGLLMPSNPSSRRERQEQLARAERWLCPSVGDGVLAQLERAAAAFDIAAEITGTEEPVPA